MGETEISQEYISDIRKCLRNSSTALDKEVEDIIKAGRADLIRAGVLQAKAEDEEDPLIKRALTNYAKAEFGLDNPDSEKYRAAYERMRTALTLATDYITEEG